LIGSAPDQIRVIEWRVRNFSGESGDFTKTFQVWLYEGTNEVRLVYGVGTDFSPTNGVVGASLGIASAAGSFQSITTSDHSVSTSVQNNGNLPWPGNGRTYLFAPPAPVALTYEWTPNTYLNNDAIANPLAQSVQGSETYVVEVGAPNGCSRLDTLELVSGVELIASIAPADTAICLNESVLLSSVVTGGGTPYTYLWDNPAASTTANITVSPLETTTYTVTVTDNCGISEEAEVTVTINPLPTIVVTPGSALFCGVDTVELVASGAESYLWSPATGLSVTDSSVVTATPTETITYTVTGTDVNGCENTGTATITVSPEVSVTLVPELANVCLGDNTNLVATASPVGFNASASSGTLSLAVPDNDLVTGLTSGLALSGTSSTVGASSVVSVTLNVTHSWNSDLQIYLVGPGNCGTLELSTNNGSSGDNYTNTVLTTPSAFPSITTAFAPMTGNWSPEGTVDGVTNVGTTTLPTTNLVGCPVDGTWNLRVFDNTEGDFGTLIDWSLSVGNGINAGTYSHVITTTGGATIGSVSNSGPNSSVGTAAVSNLDAGVNTFTVVTTSTTGCSATTTTTITAGVPLAVTIETTANPICEGDEMTLTANASGGGEPFSYLWSPGGATTQSIAVSPTDDTEYTVTVEDACDNTVAESVTIVVNDRPSAVASASLACVGGDLQLTGVSDTGTEFTWSGPDGFASTDQNPSISGVTAVNSGDYIFTATLGDCSASSTVSVTVNAASSPVTVNPTTINSCFGNTVPLTASGGTGGVPATASVGGTSASTSSGSLTPFYRLFENYRVQYLVRAVDLQNAGIVAGNLTSLAFNVTALGTTTGGFPNNMEDYTVKIGTTASTVVTSTAPLSSTFTTVFGPVSYSPTLGVNTLNFATPFNWNGSSNIVIDICFDNDPAATCNAGSPVCWGNTPTVNVANASYTGTWSSAADDVARCGYTGSGSTTNTRPVMSFGYTTQQQPVYTWSPATGLSSTTGPTVTATVGSTIQYTVTATLPSGCSNQGTSDIIVDPNATTVTLELRSDDGSEVSWEIVTLTDVVVCEGGDYPVEADIITANCCLAQGCYRLRVMDSGGDGFGTAGGYQLRTLGSDPTDIRIIDNLGNFTNLTANGSLSAIGNGPSAFCFPFAADPKPQFQHRDKLDFVSGNYLISEEVAAVSAQWQVGNQTDDGYEFWIYDPNGTYAYRRFRNHATSDGFANVGATRACHMKINNWFASQAAPANVLLNVRIRPRVNGVNGPFGPAYRFKIDPARAACPLTKLNDFPGNQFESCDQTRTWGSGIIHAIPVPSANQYQWRFRTVGEPLAPIIVRTTTTYFLQLNWPTNPLIPGKTYTVDVRARKGTTWCTDAVAPALVDPWGTICSLTIVGGNAQGGGEQLVLEGNSANLAMFPNPNRGDQLWLSLDGIEEGVTQVSVDIYDMAGHRAVARMIPTQGTNLNTVLDLSGTDAGGSLAAGVYVVHIMAGDARYTERLVIQR
jgi:subtilisin-like proprotein convertase family protein